METRTKEITYAKNKKIKLGIIPGHFATNHSHAGRVTPSECGRDHESSGGGL